MPSRPRINDNGSVRDMTDQEIAAYTPPLDAVRAVRSELITAARNGALAVGYQPQDIAWRFRGTDVDKITSDAVYLQTRLLLAADSESRSALLGSTINVPTDQGPQPLTVTQAIAAYSEFGSWSRAIIEQHEQRQRAIQTASSVEAVEAIVW